MTYGRLDVYWPDGPIDSYQLNKSNVAIGRSPGNDVTIDATAISRYHVSISLRDSLVFLEDLGSVNGTYVDGRRLEPNAPQPLLGGEEKPETGARDVRQLAEIESAGLRDRVEDRPRRLDLGGVESTLQAENSVVVASDLKHLMSPMS